MIFPEIEGKIEGIRYPCYVDAKLDGMSAILLNGRVYNKYGRVYNFPYFDNTFPYAISGELCYGEGLFGDLYLLNSNKNDINLLTFYAFDIDIPDELRDRKRILRTVIKEESDHLRIVPHMIASSYCDIQRYKEMYIKMGYEGIVVKNVDSTGGVSGTNWVKLKNKMTADLRLVYLDPIRERGEVDYKGVMVGVKIANKYKPTLKEGDIVEIEYQGVLSKGSLRHPVFKRKRGDKCEPSYN